MSESEIAHMVAQALLLSLQLSGPVLVTATFVGLLVSVLQAVTQIQEQTLQFSFKLVAIIVVLLLTGRWMVAELHHFSALIFDMIASAG